MDAQLSKVDSEVKFNWFSLRVSSGKERVVEENIMFESKMNKIEKLIDEVFVPFEKVVQVKNNKKQIKERVFFPGYILIKMALTPQTKYVIEKHFIFLFNRYYVAALEKEWKRSKCVEKSDTSICNGSCRSKSWRLGYRIS